MENTIELAVAFLVGCLMTYLVLYLPSMRICKEYQERLEARLRARS